MGKFVIKRRTNGDYQFNLKADNGQIILSSQGYATRSSCENGIVSVKRHAQADSNFERKKSANGKHYFNLKAGNGEIIGTSEMYEGTSSMDNGISSVMKNAPNASIEE
jgi:uncharacterized protein YegP (UPF0339 family)